MASLDVNANTQPTKRRRGRPPKFFAIWTSQYLLEKLYSMETPPMFAQLPVEDNPGHLEKETPCLKDRPGIAVAEDRPSTPPTQPIMTEDKQTDDHNNNNNNNNNNNPAFEPKTENPSPSPSPYNTSDDNSPTSPYPAENYKNSEESSGESDLSKLSTNHQNQTSSQSTDDSGTCQATGEPAVNKRRPGRPRGSYKKFSLLPARRTMSEEFVRDARLHHANGDVTAGDHVLSPSVTVLSPLKQFYEAGGRDYESYLKWRDANMNMRRGKPVQDSYNHDPPKTVVTTSPPTVSPNDPLSITARAKHTWYPPVAECLVHRESHKYRRVSAPEPFPGSEAIDLSVKRKRKLDRIYPGVVKMPLYGIAPQPPSHGCSPRDHRAKSHVGDVASKPAVARGNRDIHAESSLSADVTGWTVSQVARFVSSIPLCQDYVDAFKLHSIDGTILPFITERHLLQVFGMKLGPAINLQRALAQLQSE